MAVIATDECVYPNGIVLAGVSYAFGDTLPAPGPADAPLRAALRGTGMIRPVTETTTWADFTAQVAAVTAGAPAGYVLALAPAGLTVVSTPGP